ncbi:MAG: D-ala D-ala ligase C-terminus, partial [Pseudomonadota bacterium]
GRALTVTEIQTDIDFYNYEAKYAACGSRHIVPANLNKALR